MRNSRRGFTLTETIISIFILILLGAIGIGVFYGSREAKNLDVITDGLNFTLELAKSDALAGKGGANTGVYFASTSYTYFMGSTYDSSAITNKTGELPPNWSLNATLANGASTIIFSRLTGVPQTTATVTISNLNDPSLTRSITVGPQGNISVIK